ncbi:LOW QUALITY PROTEIN: hypothetical protein BC936DRAFT_144240 [Jimgerdemannia flammicorona]|uniref:Uncharacterized protein n=2 Tax=Jimgerdemannia flammicorona TaxID=994334 RepID=A0A433QM20_9FUNG|nr:LOW QUALITY PROTEIN: hypothetical protein BC936DRAFT_144240 [Jimgerdemannia flammicorona]RUS30824.1 LOW QUALITY PROTEIN: hypothetical protein BC938DRAFT_478915 [Jimgerdemannia flammicorona]
MKLSSSRGDFAAAHWRTCCGSVFPILHFNINNKQLLAGRTGKVDTSLHFPFPSKFARPFYSVFDGPNAPILEPSGNNLTRPTPSSPHTTSPPPPPPPPHLQPYPTSSQSLPSHPETTFSPTLRAPQSPCSAASQPGTPSPASTPPPDNHIPAATSSREHTVPLDT